ncbi:MAG: hypothetical protein WC955_13330 [Elusimicrobiota bacterium]
MAKKVSTKKVVTLNHNLESGFVNITFSKLKISCYGGKVTFSKDNGKTYNNCAVYPAEYGDTSVLYHSLWSWNEAVNYGNVKFNGKPTPLNWNLFFDSMHTYSGEVLVRVELITISGIEVMEQKVVLTPSKTVYFTDWKKVIPSGTPWIVPGTCLAVDKNKIVGTKPFEPVKIRLGVEGRYRIFFGLPNGNMRLSTKLSGDKALHPFNIAGSRLEYNHKVKKEVFFREADLTKETVLELNMIPHGVRNPDICGFGKLAYLKLVPVVKHTKSTKKFGWQTKKLAVYFEPFSWAYMYGLTTRVELDDIIAQFKSIGVDEVHTQVMRFGTKSLHKSKILEANVDIPPIGDDHRGSPGPVEMRKSLDILKDTIESCNSAGLMHYTNIGLTNCYPGTPGEDKFSREHPEYRTKNILRYNRPETINYAASIVNEIVEDYDTPGFSIDCLRYPYYHTESELIALFERIIDVLEIQGKKRGKKVPFALRIPEGDITYYRALWHFVKSGKIEYVVPSSIHTRKPIYSLKPYIKWQKFGCKVYGRIDGWKEFAHDGGVFFNPKDIKEDIERYMKEGADGVFVYQADLHLVDAYTKHAIDKRNW